MILIARIALIALACAAIGWGLSVYPQFWQVASSERVAKRIIAGEPFKDDVLSALLPSIDTIDASTDCSPAAIQAVAVIRLRMVEQAIASANRLVIDDNLSALQGSIGRSLRCAPSDPFLWIVLFWLENTTGGFTPDHFKYLRMSYGLGPNEGWIALRRSRISLSLFEQLPTDLAEATTKEFVRLVSDFVDDAVEIFVGPGWRLRELLLARMKDAPIAQRQRFAQLLRSKDYDLDVPGVERPEVRWRR
jgi:hypothetical protein